MERVCKDGWTVNKDIKIVHSKKGPVVEDGRGYEMGEYINLWVKETVTIVFVLVGIVVIIKLVGNVPIQSFKEITQPTTPTLEILRWWAWKTFSICVKLTGVFTALGVMLQFLMNVPFLMVVLIKEEIQKIEDRQKNKR